MKIPKSLFSGRALVRMASGRGPSRSKMYARDLEGECSSTKRGSPPSSVLLAASLAICGGVSTLWAYHTAVIQDDILKQRRVPVRNPCEVDAYGGGVSPAAGHASSCAERRVLAHECSTPYAIVASWTCDRSAPAPPTARACSTAAPHRAKTPSHGGLVVEGDVATAPPWPLIHAVLLLEVCWRRKGRRARYCRKRFLGR